MSRASIFLNTASIVTCFASIVDKMEGEVGLLGDTGDSNPDDEVKRPGSVWGRWYFWLEG